MINITVMLRSGELKYDHSGQKFRGHTLRCNRNESITATDERPMEVELFCMTCEEKHVKKIRTTDDWRVDLLYLYMCGLFKRKCPAPKHHLSKAAKSAWRKHKGKPLTNDVRMEMVEEIREACDDHIQVSFE